MISGTVELDDGTAVENATMTAINESTDPPTVEATTTTDASGYYEFSLPSGDSYEILMEYDDGDAQYQAESKPFIDTS